jgi:hypothetical protein
MFNFNQQFFEKHQNTLLFISNKRYLRWLLGLHRLPKELEGKRIDKITPNSIHHNLESKLTKKGRYKKQKYTAEFFARPRFAEALAYNLSPFCYFQELRSQRFRWRFSPVGLAYILLFGLLGKFAGLPLAFMGTTTSYYDDAGDGCVYKTASTYSAAREATSGTGTVISGEVYVQSIPSGANFQICRTYYPVITSDLPDICTITDATLNFYQSNVVQNLGSHTIALIQTTQDPSTLGVDDYNNLTLNTPDEGATRITPQVTQYNKNTFTLNATGISWISKTGDSLFGIRADYDVDNETPSNEDQINVGFYDSAKTGTDYDPYLAVTYTVAAGPANLKSYNTNLKANIKTINTNLIANVKSLNTNT